MKRHMRVFGLSEVDDRFVRSMELNVSILLDDFITGYSSYVI
jgi:predicted signal transduction protein with EAL and GGDEF domain